MRLYSLSWFFLQIQREQKFSSVRISFSVLLRFAPKVYQIFDNQSSNLLPPVLDQEGYPCPRYQTFLITPCPLPVGVVPVQDRTFPRKSLSRASSSAPPCPQPGKVSLSGVLILTRPYPRLLPCFLTRSYHWPCFLRGTILGFLFFLTRSLPRPCF